MPACRVCQQPCKFDVCRACVFIQGQAKQRKNREQAEQQQLAEPAARRACEDCGQPCETKLCIACHAKRMLEHSDTQKQLDHDRAYEARRAQHTRDMQLVHKCRGCGSPSPYRLCATCYHR